MRLSTAQIVQGLDLWLDLYISNPEQFKQAWQGVALHQAERANGKQPSYGESGNALMVRLLTDAGAIAPCPTGCHDGLHLCSDGDKEWQEACGACHGAGVVTP